MSVLTDEPLAMAQLATSPPTVAQSQNSFRIKRDCACETCYRRKIKCDRTKPKCSTCARSGQPCHYVIVRSRKSVRKRSDIQLLEDRLKELEALLTSQDEDAGFGALENTIPLPQLDTASTLVVSFASPIAPATLTSDMPMNGDFDFGKDMTVVETTALEDFSWDLITLGLEEALPSPEITNKLYTIFFKQIHPSMPFIHQARFMSSLNMSVNQRPPVCLSYIIWALACTLLPEYKLSAEEFYRKSRMYAERDELAGVGESFISIGHTQCWVLICRFEYQAMYLPRAWVSAGRASRLSLLQGLNRLDAVSDGFGIKQSMPPAKDWIEKEERRRTFWIVYCQDQYASLGGGWPSCIDERDILTDLPATEEAYLTGTAETTPTLKNALSDPSNRISLFAERCVLATLFGRNRTHLQQPTLDNCDHDLNGEFWNSHRLLDSIVLRRSLALPDSSGLTCGFSNPNVIFANIQIHAIAICLHQGAIAKAEKYCLYSISAESRRRCITAAHQITTIMRKCTYQDLSLVSPFMGYCLYVAARVLVQNLDSDEDEGISMHSSLNILRTLMSALRLQNPLIESFLRQLDVELGALGSNNSELSSTPSPRRYPDAVRDKVSDE